MSSTGATADTSSQPAEVGTTDLKLEVVTLPVSDVDRAKAFYQSLGWRLDADLSPRDGVRVVQFTPPQSDCSIHFGQGLTAAEPGAVDRLILIVDDIDAAREDLTRRGVEVTDVSDTRPPGQDSRSYFEYASFKDPDGNGWLLQEITTRLPGRVWEKSTTDVAALADLLHETSEHHGVFEAVAPPHHWWDWYAAYASSREGGSSPEEADAAAGRYMADVKHIVVSPA